MAERQRTQPMILLPESHKLLLTERRRAVICRSIRGAATRCDIRLTPEEVEDLMQDVLLRLCQSGKEEKLETCLAFVCRVAERSVFDTVRKWRAQKRTASLKAQTELRRVCGKRPRTPEDLLLAQEEFRVFVEWCRIQMSGRLFQMFSLVYLVGLPRREVGRLIGLSKSGVDAALSRLRQTFQEHGRPEKLLLKNR